MQYDTSEKYIQLLKLISVKCRFYNCMPVSVCVDVGGFSLFSVGHAKAGKGHVA